MAWYLLVGNDDCTEGGMDLTTWRTQLVWVGRFICGPGVSHVTQKQDEGERREIPTGHTAMRKILMRFPTNHCSEPNDASGTYSFICEVDLPCYFWEPKNSVRDVLVAFRCRRVSSKETDKTKAFLSRLLVEARASTGLSNS